MKKISTIVFFAVFCLLMLNVTRAADATTDTLPASCIAYNDGCNTCSRIGTGSEWACTMMYCSDNQTVKTCTAFAQKTVGEGELANGTVSPEYQTSCASGLSSMYPYTGSYQMMMGAPVLCYNAQKGAPICKDESSGVKAGWYYSNGTLLKAMNCNQGTNQTDPVACTMEYAPVCGAVQVQCFTTPCNPIPETFSNKCMLNANKNATFLYNGECKADLKPGEGFVYDSVAKVLDKSYLARKFTPIQAANYTQSIIQKIDDMMQVSKMKQWAYNKHVQLKRFLQIYISLGQK